MTSTVERYATTHMIPALLGIIFALTGLFTFEAIAAPQFLWIDYTLTTEHSVLVGLLAFAGAFATSATRQPSRYDTYEQAIIALGPALLISMQYVSEVSTVITDLGNAGLAGAFLVTMMSWIVAVR